MGHKRLGNLPNTGGWRRFKKALADTAIDAENVAQAGFDALSRYLPDLHDEPGLSYCYWLLAQIVWQSRDKRYFDALKAQGIDVGPPEGIRSTASFISRLAATAQTSLSRDPNAGVFSNIAQLALRETLGRALSPRAETLFGTTSDDIRTACRDLSTTKQFGALSRNFFASYLNRLLGYFIEREIPSHIGPEARFKTPDEVKGFQETVKSLCDRYVGTLENYFHERARIVESYAGAYGSLHAFQRNLSLPTIRKQFIPQALTKLQSEIAKSERSPQKQKEAAR